MINHKDRHIELKNFVTLFGELHSLCVSDTVTKEFASVLQLVLAQLGRQHHCTTTEVLNGINSAIISHIKEVSVPEEATTMAINNIAGLPAESRGKNSSLYWLGCFQRAGEV